jgi:hypothetical protein
VRVEERELDRQVGEQMLLLLHELKRGQGRLDLAAVIHPDAEMRLLIAYGAVVRGRDRIVAALERAQRDTGLYEASVRRFEWLDDQTALTFGRARYRLPAGGYADGKVFWLDEFRDRLIWRAHVFMREQGARQTYEERLEARVRDLF